MSSEVNQTLFYVEDDEALAFVTSRALTKRGFDVRHFYCVDAAMKAIPELHASYAILDLKVGEQLSLSLIDCLKHENIDCRILILTGYGSIATAVQAIKLGACDYLTKPTAIEAILNVLSGVSVDDAASSLSPKTEGLSLKRLEWENIQRVLAQNNGNVSATARQLKMHRRTLQRKLDKRPVGQ